ncbi:hypothetical protein D3C73_1376800 [compost metagenome]
MPSAPVKISLPVWVPMESPELGCTWMVACAFGASWDTNTIEVMVKSALVRETDKPVRVPVPVLVMVKDFSACCV